MAVRTLWHRAIDPVVYGALRAVVALLLSIPPRTAERLARSMARAFLRIDRTRRETARENLRVAFSVRLTERQRERLLVRSYEHAFVVGMEVVWRPRLLPSLKAYRRCTEIFGDVPAIREDLRAGRGGFILGGHLGNWEMSGGYLCAEGVPLAAVGRRIDNPYVHDWLTRLRGGEEVMIEKAGAVRQVLKAVERGRFVGMLADQNAGKGGMFVPFFGVAASTFRTPAALAVRARIPVYFAAAIRRGSGFRYEFRLRKYEIPEEGDMLDRERRLLEAYSLQIEEWTREAPEQYLWLHRRWRTRPEGDAPGPHLPSYARFQTPLDPPLADESAYEVPVPPAR